VFGLDGAGENSSNRRMRMYFILGLVAFAASAAADDTVFYRLSADQYSAGELARPAHALPPPESLVALNQYDGGHFNAQRIEFHYDADGNFHRVGTRMVDFIREAARARQIDCQNLLQQSDFGSFIMNHIVHGSVMKHVDNQALDEMVNRNYISGEKKEGYMEGSHALQPEQLVYLETSSLMSPREVKFYFGGIIPWSRISEVQAPRGLTEQQVRSLAQEESPKVKLRLRRATLRVVAGQAIDPSLRGFAQYRLPFMNDGSDYQIDSGKTPLVFELGRASQIAGAQKEIQQLVAVAVAIIYQQVSVMPVYGFHEFPPQEVEIMIQSLDAGHTAGYRMKLGARPVAGGEPSLLHVSLSEAMDKVGRHLKHSTVMKLVDFITEQKRRPRWPDFFYALSWIRIHREANLRVLDLSWEGQELTDQGPIIFRSSPESAREVTLSRLRNTPNEVAKHAEGIMKVLDDMNDFDFFFSFGTRVDEFKNPKLVWNDNPRAYLVSGLSDFHAAKDPQYVKKVLLGLTRYLSRDWFNEKDEFIVAASQPSLRSQLAAFAFAEPLEGSYRFNLNRLLDTLTKDPLYAESDAKLRAKWDGFWQRFWILKHLPGI
jgi:hypothetical protein